MNLATYKYLEALGFVPTDEDKMVWKQTYYHPRTCELLEFRAWKEVEDPHFVVDSCDFPPRHNNDPIWLVELIGKNYKEFDTCTLDQFADFIDAAKLICATSSETVYVTADVRLTVEVSMKELMEMKKLDIWTKQTSLDTLAERFLNKNLDASGWTAYNILDIKAVEHS